MASAMEMENTWILDSTIGEGAFGIVQLWKNIHNGEKIATKMCKSDHTQLTLRQKQRWMEEIKIMNALQHPNIIGTKPVPDEIKKISPSLPILCMEYCKKGDLRHVLNEIENCCGLAESVAIQAMKDISGAVEYLHCREVTHRDLKPENVVIQKINDKVIYKLIDLGYAKELGHDSVYASIVGTLNYVAPELLWNHKYTCSVDYWSLGILFYEIITGYRPFLPDESSPIKWRTCIEKKSYEDICVQRVHGNIVFQQDIQDPTDISPSIREALIDWFRIVLQWDSRKRGKRQQNNTHEIVVFKMLKRILSKKVLRIFCVPQYKVYSYQIDDTERLSTLQLQIERDTRINKSSQEFVNCSGELLKDDQILQDTFLTLFRKESVQLVEPPALNLPILVKKMLEMPKVEMSRYELKRSYASAMFYMKTETELFKYYILALSMKIDLISTSFDILKSKTAEMVSAIESLKKEFHSMNELLQCDVQNGLSSWQKEIQTTRTKLKCLSEIVNNLQTKCNQFLRICDTLREFGQVDWMEKYQEFLNRVQNFLNSYRTCSTQVTHQPVPMARLIVQFLTLRQAQLNDPRLNKIASQITLMSTVQVTEERSKFEKFVDSAVALTTVYRKELFNFHKKWQNRKRMVSSDVNVVNMDIENNTDSSAASRHSVDEIASVSSDGLIYDNLVIRYMMHDIISDTYQMFLQITNADP